MQCDIYIKALLALLKDKSDNLATNFVIIDAKLVLLNKNSLFNLNTNIYALGKVT